MNSLLIALKIDTTYQIYSFAALVIGLILVSTLLVHFITKETKLTLLALASNLIFFIFATAIIAAGGKFLNSELSSQLNLAYWLAYIFNVVNVATLTGLFYLHKHKKKFDPDHVTREHFNSTLNLFVIVIIAGCAFAVFMPTSIIMVIAYVITMTIISIWSNHFIARKVLVDQRSK